MHTLKINQVLVYYDEPQLFLAYDQLQTAYLCLLAAKNDEHDNYLCVPISKRRFSDFITGKMDLRTILTDSETGEVFLSTIGLGELDSFQVKPINPLDIDNSWLPEPDFFFNIDALTDALVIKESQERHRAIIHCSLNPPEARDESKISADILSQAIKIIQRVVTYAYKRILRDIENKEFRDIIGQPEYYRLEVTSFSRGSFKIHMQTSIQSDLFGYSHIAKAMQIIDKINENIDEPNTVVQLVAGYGGHFATAYKDLLQFIIENDTPISYEWTMPSRKDTTIRRITEIKAEPIYRALQERTDIGKEERLIAGILRKADKDYGTWRLYSPSEKKEYTGKALSHDVISGLEIDAQYEFLCDEQLVQERGTGRESVYLILISYRRL